MKLVYENINNYSLEEYKVFLTTLKKEKQYKISNILKDDDKRRSILGEILFINLLNELNIDYNSITITKNKYGKPYIKDLDLFFNISHSKDFVVCVISKNEIGIDIEQIRETKESIINQFATTKEKQYINEFKNEYNKRAFEIFTLKESYFKCLGTNLNHIKDIEFELTNNIIKCNKKDFEFKLTHEIDNYIIAICEKRGTLWLRKLAIIY